MIVTNPNRTTVRITHHGVIMRLQPQRRGHLDGAMQQPELPGIVTPLAPTAWRPDKHLIDAALAGRIYAKQLPGPDRAWLIAQLTHRGMAAAFIAERLHCSPRLVKSIRAEPVAVLTAQLLRATTEPNARHRRQSPDTAAVVIANYVRQIDQLKHSRGQLINALAQTKARCGKPATIVQLIPCSPNCRCHRPKHRPLRQPALFEELN